MAGGSSAWAAGTFASIGTMVVGVGIVPTFWRVARLLIRRMLKIRGRYCGM